MCKKTKKVTKFGNNDIGEELEYNGKDSNGSQEQEHYKYSVPVHFLKPGND